MFLARNVGFGDNRRFVAAFIIILPCLLLGSVNGQAVQNGCTLDVPVYGPTGAQLAFRISRVSPFGRNNVDLLAMPGSGFQVQVPETRLAFPRTVLSRTLRITLEDRAGRILTQSIELGTCQQRVSLRYGVSASVLGDSSSETVIGRLSDCRFDGDWWMLAMPIFGVLGSSVSEGVVQPDGSFAISGGLRDGRYLAVIGKGAEPVKTIAFNVQGGASPKNLGTVSLRGVCPSQSR